MQTQNPTEFQYKKSAMLSSGLLMMSTKGSISASSASKNSELRAKYSESPQITNKISGCSKSNYSMSNDYGYNSSV